MERKPVLVSVLVSSSLKGESRRRDLENEKKVLRLANSKATSGRIRGRQTLAMPILHSTTIQMPAGTIVHEASVWTTAASSGNRTMHEMHTKQPSMKMPMSANFFDNARRKSHSQGMGNNSIRMFAPSSEPVMPHERDFSLIQ